MNIATPTGAPNTSALEIHLLEELDKNTAFEGKETKLAEEEEEKLSTHSLWIMMRLLYL